MKKKPQQKVDVHFCVLQLQYSIYTVQFGLDRCLLLYLVDLCIWLWFNAVKNAEREREKGKNLNLISKWFDEQGLSAIELKVASAFYSIDTKWCHCTYWKGKHGIQHPLGVNFAALMTAELLKLNVLFDVD